MRLSTLAGALLTAGILLCQPGGDPWPATAMMEPAVLAKALKTSHVICVAFPVLYKTKHIPGAAFAGPGAKAEGIEALKKAVSKFKKDDEIVLYCGCCPMDHCPNIRPAFKALADMGYTKVRVLNIPTNMHTDWTSKGYPGESGGGL